MRRLVVYLAAACGLSPREAWGTDLRELAAIGKAAAKREKRLMGRWR